MRCPSAAERACGIDWTSFADGPAGASWRVSTTLIGLLLLILPQPFFLARLPALVALKPPAEYPLMILWLVRDVPEELFVATLWKPLDELVALDFVVKVRSSIALPSS